MEWINVVVLAIVQGIAEFLPISSTGHLVVFSRWFDSGENEFLLIVVLHAGTLGSILLYYRRELLDLFKPENRSLIKLLVVGTLPLVGVGVPLHMLMSDYGSNIWLVSCGFLTTACFLIGVHRDSGEGRELGEMTCREAVIIGCVQAVAVLPGVSRSGSTIAIATRLGIGSKAAAQFSFFLAIPAIMGGVVLELKDMMVEGGGDSSMQVLGIGLLTAFVVGFLALKLLITVLKRGKLVYFGYYCLLLAVGVMLAQFL